MTMIKKVQPQSLSLMTYEDGSAALIVDGDTLRVLLNNDQVNVILHGLLKIATIKVEPDEEYQKRNGS